jgi:BirA family biotin operon repressor/biotin-[acetyl-CoA-carboxylase] ligase
MSGTAFEVRRFDQIDSTNTYLVSQALQGAPDGLVAVARHQLAGRGRLGRSWIEPPGSSLLTSILFRVPLGPERLYLVSVAVSVSALKAIEVLTGTAPRLKWPNDLLLDGRKVAGVLAELVEMGCGPALESTVVVGIGVNLTWSGPPEAGGTSLLDSTGHQVSADALLEGLLAELSGRVEALRDPARHDELSRELHEHLGTLGTLVRIELPGEELIATATGVSAEGHLIVESEEGVREIVTGDLIHLRAQP